MGEESQRPSRRPADEKEETCLDESETEWLQHYRRSHRETPASGRRRSPRRRREEHAEPDDGFEWDGVSGEGEKELGEVVDFTQATEEDEEAASGTRQWLIDNKKRAPRTSGPVAHGRPGSEEDDEPGPDFVSQRRGQRENVGVLGPASLPNARAPLSCKSARKKRVPRERACVKTGSGPAACSLGSRTWE